MFRKVAGLFIVVSTVGWFGVWAVEVPFNSANTIVSSFDGAAGIAMGDLNGNGTVDITICARDAGIVRHQSNLGSGAWAYTVVDSGLDSPYSIAVGDIDGDGDGDILVGQLNNVAVSTPPYPAQEAELIWYENPKNGGVPGWQAHGIVYLVYDGTRKVELADMDQDGDLDAVYSYGGTYGGVSWVENDGTDSFGSSHPISSDPVAPYGLAVADINGDGALDVVLADSSREMVTWYDNDGTDYWDEHVIDAFLDGATDVAVGDADGDGIVDVAAVGFTAGEVVMYINSSVGGSWSEGVVTGLLTGARAVSFADMDSDGDQDILAAGSSANQVAWYENTTGLGNSWVTRLVDGSFTGAFDIEAGDVDGDGDPEIFASGFTGDTVAFWRNRQCHRRFRDAAAQDIRTSLADPRAVEVADVNGDGLQDVVSGLWDDGKVIAIYGVIPDSNTWYYNASAPVATGFVTARDVSVADMDGDGDLDILGAAVGSDAIRWWANGGGATPSWTAHDILTSYDGAHRVEAADFDRDGDMDVAVCAYDEDNWAWLENTNGLGTAWTRRDFTPLNGAFDLAVGDLNFDGSPDLVATGYDEDKVQVVLNNMPDSNLWGLVTVATGLDGPRGVDLGDFDDDGDLDIVVVVRNDNHILWFENDGTGINWTQHNVGTGTFVNGVAVRAVDLDNDGDVDVVATNQDQNDVVAWLNDGDGASWVAQGIESGLDNTWDLDVADVDNDGKMDVVVAAGGTADRLTWYENVGGQFRQHYFNDAPSSISNKDVLLTAIVSHNGRTGYDADLEPSVMALEFTDGGGTPLTSTQVNNLLERLELYEDTDDDGYWDPTDTVVATDLYISLSGGVLTWVLPDGLAAMAVEPGSGHAFSIVATALPGASGQIVATLHDRAVEAEDANYDLDLESESNSAVTTGVVLIGDGIFYDGFESGTFSQWSSHVGG